MLSFDRFRCKFSCPRSMIINSWKENHNKVTQDHRLKRNTGEIWVWFVDTNVKALRSMKYFNSIWKYMYCRNLNYKISFELIIFIGFIHKSICKIVHYWFRLMVTTTIHFRIYSDTKITWNSFNISTYQIKIEYSMYIIFVRLIKGACIEYLTLHILEAYTIYNTIE